MNLEKSVEPRRREEKLRNDRKILNPIFTHPHFFFWKRLKKNGDVPVPFIYFKNETRGKGESRNPDFSFVFLRVLRALRG